MIFDLLERQPAVEERRDVCIVGAGAAGIALAVELVSLGKSVVLLEGGGISHEEAAQEPYSSLVAGLPHRGIHEGRVRVHGGTTTKWGGQILELAGIDFEQRTWIAESGWPMRKEELEPFYRRALEIEGLGESIQEDAAVWRALKLPVPQFADVESYLSRWCPEPNFARLHRDVLASEAIEVWLHANAVELLLEGAAVQGIRCRTQAGRQAIFRANEYVFAIGAIESSRFFLQPRAGNPLPWNASGLLGKHFQDHIDVNAAEVRPRSAVEFHRSFDNIFLNGYKYHPKIRLAPAVEEAEGLLNAAATMNFVSDLDEQLGQIKATAKHLLRGRFKEVDRRQVATMLRNTPLLLQQTARYAFDHRAFVPANATTMLRVHCEQEPSSASAVTLTDERDSLGMLRTRLDWRISSSELRTIRHFVEVARRSLAALAEVNPVAAFADDAALTAICDDSNHHMGGMRMAASPAQGVVSTELLLNGTCNCYILSAAVFPTSGFSNPTHTLIALAVRLARHLTRSGAVEASL